MDIAQARGIILFISAFLSLISAFLFWFKYKGKDKTIFHLGWVAFFSALYCFIWGGRFFFEHHKIFWSRATWLGILILPAYLTCLYYATKRTKYLKLKSLLWYLLGIIIVFLALATPYFVESIPPEYPYSSSSRLGALKLLGRLYIVICLGISLFYLLTYYFKAKGFEKWQLKYHIIGATIYSVGGLLVAGIVPLFYYPKFTYIDISAILSTVWVGLLTYAVFKRQLYEIRVILTEVLVGTISIILLVQAFLSQSPSTRILGFITFFSFLFAGYLLIRVTQKEIQKKEQAEKLAQELEQLNETLDQRVEQRTKQLQERTNELEEFYNLTVGRELKIVELKKKIKKLKDQSK